MDLNGFLEFLVVKELLHHPAALVESTLRAWLINRCVVQTGRWPADVGRQLEDVQKQFALLNQLTAAPATQTALVVAASEQADRTLLVAQAVTESIEKMGACQKFCV